jgi:hypothetical protein
MITQNSIKLTILFQEKFWVGIFERQDEQGYAVARAIFGPEPTDPEVSIFLLRDYTNLRFTTPDKEDKPAVREYKNPKRQLREVRQIQKKQPAATVSKAQDALRIELEKNKITRKKVSGAQRRLEEQKQFEIKQEKKKEKLRGH